MTTRDLATLRYRYPETHPAHADVDRLVSEVLKLRTVLRAIQRDTHETQTYASCQQALEEA